MWNLSLRFFFATAILAAGPAPAGAHAAAPDAGSLPSFDEVRRAVETYFKGLPDFTPGALIVQSEARQAVARVEALGWHPEDAAKILNRVPADTDPLARLLRTPGGRRFGLQAARYKLGYDRIDRLLRLPRGERMVGDLIRGPDGYKMIEYMTSTPGGAYLGSQLSRAPRGSDFNRPTGRIYTMQGLLEALRESYEAALSRTAAGRSASRR